MHAATVLRLRVAAQGLDPLVTRLRAAAVLESATLQPGRLPPAAILCVRSLRDPRPRTVRLTSAQPFTTQRVAPLWQNALTARLDDLSRRAVRPLLEGVPATAEAVVFADRAELLACLALDWLRGHVLERWWWAHILRNVEPRQAVVRTWLEAPDCIPAALAHLARTSDCVAFVLALSTPEVARATEVVIDTFGVRPLAAVLRDVERPSAAARRAKLATGPEPRPEPVRNHDGSPAPVDKPRAPWVDYLPAEARALSADREFLLGVCVSLARQPAEVRTHRFGVAARAWAVARIAEVRHLPSAPLDVLAKPPTTLRQLVGLAPPGGPHNTPPASNVQATPDERVVGDEVGAPDAVPAERAEDTPAVRHMPTSDVDLDPKAIPLLAAESADGLLEQPRPLVDEVRTRLGGVFLLVNVALSMRLYADFTNPRGDNLALPVWQFLALLGRHLLAEPADDDPLWALLASLRGDADVAEDPAAMDWVSPVETRILDALGLEQEPHRLARVLLWHSARILLTDTRLDVEFNMDEFFARDGAFAIRLSGMDRDPGWVPAAGRALAFHFT